MRKFYWLGFVILTALSLNVNAQGGYSFTCRRTVTVPGCGSLGCFALNGTFPDIKAPNTVSNDYVVNQVTASSGGCLLTPNIDPGAPGPGASITQDDRYSQVVNLPFTFNFYGTNYNQLLISGNGYLCFDPSLAGQFSHWSMTPGNVPNTSYDRGLAMGVFHDLDISVTTSPTRQIKYETIGTTPGSRQFVVSFYKIPLFGSSCNNLFENTHQIILYEGLNIIDVKVQSVQPCPSWNSGRKMIGLQNFNRNKGIMAPGRTATGPAWGSVNMNEIWRFTPSGGNIAYRAVQLLDLSGAVVANGDTTRVDASTFSVNFPNVCPTTNNPTYIIRATYENPSAPGTFIYSVDTIDVVQQGSFGASFASNDIQCFGQSTGSITITPANGTGNYEYSIDGGTTYQSSNTFPNLPAGPYHVIIRDTQAGCTKDTTINILQPTEITANATGTNESCAVQGTITINASNGTPGYTYSIDGTTYQAGNTFNLPAGNYPIYVQDQNGCVKQFGSQQIQFINDLQLTGRQDTTICLGASVTLFTNSNAASYSWTGNGLNDPSVQQPVATPTVDGVLTYNLVATLGQCTKTDEVQITVNKAVTASAGNDITIIKGETVQLNGTATGATTYLWTSNPTDNTLTSTSILNPSATPIATTTYTLTAFNGQGICKAIDEVVVTVIPYCVKVANVLTPNGDGVNDYWLVYDSYDCLKNVSITVFNRYGSKVFEDKNYQNKWNGTYSGKPLPDGTYYGVVEFTLISGRKFQVKTDVTIVR